MTQRHSLAIIGAGPAGLAAAHEAVQQGIRPLVLEEADKVGGLARTEMYKDYRFDIGGHRFFTKIEEIQNLWGGMLGTDFVTVPRLSRIYYQGQFFKYPMELVDTISKLGLTESARILFSYLKAKVSPYPQEDTFDQWVTNRFGQRLYEMFFQAYTEKVWGMPCSEIQADWAAQRIAGLSLRTIVANTLFRAKEARSLIHEFHYPILGPGMMWQRFSELVESQGGKVCVGNRVISIEREMDRITGMVVMQGGDKTKIQAENYISSMPLTELIAAINPLPPSEVVQAARRLRYRDLLVVALIAERARQFPDQWIYIQSADVQVGRIQNFGNWSAAMVPSGQMTSLGMEYFCNEGDEFWQMPDEEIIALARHELVALGLAKASDIKDGLVVRQSKAYPVYDEAYRANLATIRRFLETLDNLQSIGRNGMHRYNNMDHSMLRGMLAVRNLQGERHDLWAVNIEQVYHEGPDH